MLFTDGAEEARDARGRFFPLPKVLAEAARGQPVTPQTVLRTVFRALLDHTGGTPDDDVALLVLRNAREPRPRTAATEPGARFTPRVKAEPLR